jgi:hypothetical protein
VRSFDVELVHEGIELGLLLQAVEAGRVSCFLFERQVHALMAAILLRPAGLDEFDGNTEPEPPGGQPGEVEHGIGTGEGDAVVGANRLGQAALGERPLGCREGQLLTVDSSASHKKQEARGMVGDRQRVAIVSIVELELALEVGAP